MRNTYCLLIVLLVILCNFSSISSKRIRSRYGKKDSKNERKNLKRLWGRRGSKKSHSSILESNPSSESKSENESESKSESDHPKNKKHKNKKNKHKQKNKHWKQKSSSSLPSLSSSVNNKNFCKFNYHDKGPKKWGKLPGGAKCRGLSRSQSPINIMSSKLNKMNSELYPINFEAQFDGKIDCKITNNGHSVVVQTMKNNQLFVGLKFRAEHYKNKEFCLENVHFHWGSKNGIGSEHLIDGMQYSMEAHFEFYDCAFGDLQNALSSVGRNIAVIGVWYSVGAQNDALKDILYGYDDIILSDHYFINKVDIMSLLPKHLAYFHYDGSLTTPPCTPDVEWYLLNTVMTLSQDQIRKFRHLKDCTNEKQLSNNFRPVQNHLNDHVVTSKC